MMDITMEAIYSLTDEDLQELRDNIDIEYNRRKDKKIKQAKEAIYTKINEIKEICEEYGFNVLVAGEEIFSDDWDDVYIAQ